MKQSTHVIENLLTPPSNEKLTIKASTHAPRILLLYGSLRKQSMSRLVVEESARILQQLSAETRIFDPSGLPLPDDDADHHHPKVAELLDLMQWSEGQVWCSPERHGAMTSVMKAQIDWVPLSVGAVRPTQGKTLAVMQVEGGSQSFNTVNQLRVLGRWMRMLTIPNQSSIAKVWQEFDDNQQIKASSFYDRIVDVLEELVKFTLLTRDRKDYLLDRYSERKSAAIKQDELKKAADDEKPTKHQPSSTCCVPKDSHASHGVTKQVGCGINSDKNTGKKKFNCCG